MDKTLFIVLMVTIAATLMTLAYVFVIFRRVKRVEIQNQKIADITSYIREGAMAFLVREYKVIIPFILVVATLLALLGLIPGLQDAEGVGWESALCLVVGSLFSGLGISNARLNPKVFS